MAQVIEGLWRGGDQSPLILPGTIPLDDGPVVSELARNLENSWKPVMDADLDGAESLPSQLDATYQNLGGYGATHKIARAVFLGSAPTVYSLHRGVEVARVRLGRAAPGRRSTVEVAADTPDGFDEVVIRTVTERPNAQHFIDQGF